MSTRSALTLVGQVVGNYIAPGYGGFIGAATGSCAGGKIKKEEPLKFTDGDPKVPAIEVKDAE